jgi:4-hydroxybenzoate polyprenyltransferase
LLFIRKKLLGKEMMVINVGLSFRQGILLAFFCLIILVLQSYRILIWWDALLVLGGVFLMELYFLSKK